MSVVASRITGSTIVYRLFKSRSKKTSKLRVTGLCAGNSPVTGKFPAQRASNTENVSIWWRHYFEDFCTTRRFRGQGYDMDYIPQYFGDEITNPCYGYTIALWSSIQFQSFGVFCNSYSDYLERDLILGRYGKEQSNMLHKYMQLCDRYTILWLSVIPISCLL